MPLGDGLELFVEYATRMSPASHYRDLLRQLIANRITIRMQIASESIQEGRTMLRASSQLVLVQNNGTFLGASGTESALPVQPHIALRLRLYPRLMQHL